MDKSEKIGMLIGIIFIIPWVLMLLWNSCLVSAVSGVYEIGYFQSIGLYLLFNICFKTHKVQIAE
jgi:hypothetical protein